MFEATHCFNPPTGCSLANHTLPVIEYGHDATGGFSVTGGYRYRGTTLPALSGYYVYGDYVSGHHLGRLAGFRRHLDHHARSGDDQSLGVRPGRRTASCT